MKVAGGTKLFDLKQDPDEKEDLSHKVEMKGRLKTMNDFLRTQKKEDKAIRQAHLKGMNATRLKRDPEAEARLREIGY